MVVEGELGLELTPEGRSARSNVKFKPREGVFARMLTGIKSIKLSLVTVKVG
jgi:hypothetical protein